MMMMFLVLILQQKIVIKVQVRCDKCRSKAMETAAVADGVISVALEGENKDKVVVIGEGVDAADLASELNKKLGHASLEIVEEVKEKKDNQNENKDTTSPASYSYAYQPQYELYRVAYDPQPSPCTIM
ncbi:hypothetical protein Pint_03961 [Pistacia integerrima]|uniref:Uncharacterized protein n=1 Tax=Pistacia integerrima TaxID=434235 RepID=A0ACC0Z2G0_9ROSI|nr:hypothetical protein Pint_03961 [Pistacia integerrima]